MKKILVIILIIAVVLAAVGCEYASTVTNEKDINESEDEISMFVKIETGPDWKVYYDRETLCMYVMSDGTYNRGTFTLLVNPDGTPKLWEGMR